MASKPRPPVENVNANLSGPPVQTKPRTIDLKKGANVNALKQMAGNLADYFESLNDPVARELPAELVNDSAFLTECKRAFDAMKGSFGA